MSLLTPELCWQCERVGFNRAEHGTTLSPLTLTRYSPPGVHLVQDWTGTKSQWAARLNTKVRG